MKESRTNKYQSVSSTSVRSSMRIVMSIVPISMMAPLPRAMRFSISISGPPSRSVSISIILPSSRVFLMTSFLRLSIAIFVFLVIIMFVIASDIGHSIAQYFVVLFNIFMRVWDFRVALDLHFFAVVDRIGCYKSLVYLRCRIFDEFLVEFHLIADYLS